MAAPDDLDAEPRRCRLLDRRRKYDVESDDARAAVEDRGQHSANLGRPGNRRRAVEWRRAERLFVEGNDNRGRALQWVRIAEEPPAQPSQTVDRPTAKRIQRWGGGSNECADNDHEH